MSQSKTLCLNMIVKNEIANLERCLGSVADHIGCWVICDTGSTDGTQDFIRSFFATRNIPGELHSFPFVNFEQARNEALDRAYASDLAYDYLLFDDADMELVVEDPGFRTRLDAPAYMLIQRASSGLAYWNMRLARRDTGVRYHGVTHEHLDVPHGTQRLEGVWYKDHASGANRVDKFERDIRLLREGLEQEPDNTRYWFYLAQSYRDAGRAAEATEAYAKRAGMGGWDEEAWNAQLNEARCLRSLGDEGGFLRAALATFNQRPQRAEPLYDLARHYRERGMNDASGLFCEAGVGLPRPQQDILFVEEFVYTTGLWEEYSIAANYARDPARKDRGHAACNWLALSRDVPEGSRNLARSNLYYYVQSAGVMLPSFTAHPVGFTPPDGFNPLNPSIARQGEQIVMIQRTGNWSVTDEGQYWVPDGGPVRTRNFLLHLNPNLDTESSREILAPEDWPEPLSGHVLGFEDPRLFSWRDELWCSSTVKELNPAGWCQQVLARIDCQEPSQCRLTDWRVLGPGGETAWHEKNWMPQVVSDDLHFIYLCDPTRRVDESGRQIAETPAPIAAEQFRGGSQAIAFEGGWLVLIHEVTFHGSRRSYHHRFVWLDAANVLRRVSRRFFFHQQGIEFAAGLAWHPDNKRLLISYGVGDKKAWIATVGANDVRRVLEDTGSLLSTANPSPNRAHLRALPMGQAAKPSNSDARRNGHETNIESLRETLEREPENARCWFDLATSYFDAGQIKEAAEAYSRRAGMGGWDEEAWYARLQEARCLRDLGHEGGFLRTALVAFNQRPQRAEPLYDLARFYRERGMNDVSMLFCEAGLAIPWPSVDTLFLDDFVYTAGLREEYSIVANYARDNALKDRGHAACEWLALSRQVPEHTRSLARRNLIFYARPLLELAPSFAAHHIAFEPPPGWTPSNPGLARWGNDIWCLIRTGNYGLADDGTYTLPPGEVFKTRNYLARLDDNLTPLSINEISMPADWPVPSKYYQGFQDCRLFVWRDDLWVSAGVNELSPQQWSEIALARISQPTSDPRLTDHRILVPAGPKQNEKNWMAWVDGNALRFVYLLDPGRIIDDKARTIAESTPPLALDHQRGGSPLLAFDDGWLTVTHEVATPVGGVRRYLHRWVWFDRDGIVQRISSAFCLLACDFEFVVGLIWHPDRKRLVMSFGRWDREAWVATVSAADVRGMLVFMPGPRGPIMTTDIAAFLATETNHALRTVAVLNKAVALVDAFGWPRDKAWDHVLAIGHALKMSRDATILDAGGDTHFLRSLRQHGFRDLTGINLLFTRPEVLDGVLYRHGEITATDVGSSVFDLIACLSVIQHSVNVPAFLVEMARIMKPGGLLFISFDYWADPVDTGGRIANGVPLHIFTRQEVETLVEEAARVGLTVVGDFDLSCQEKVVDWDGLGYTFGNLLFRRGAHIASPAEEQAVTTSNAGDDVVQPRGEAAGPYDMLERRDLQSIIRTSAESDDLNPTNLLQHEGECIQTVQKSGKRVLVLYAYFERDELYKANLRYFLASGIRSDVSYVICINGTCSVPLPSLDNIKYLHRENLGYDFGAYDDVINGIVDINAYGYFIFVNCTVRGPFFRDGVRADWTSAFISMIGSETKLVGSTINILSANFTISQDFKQLHGFREPYPHVQSMAFAMDHECLAFLIKSGFFQRGYEPDKEAVILNHEIMLSQLVLRNGWNISCLLPRYQGVDYRSLEEDINPTSMNGDPCFAGAYFGDTIGPHDVIFLKSNRYVIDAESLERISCQQLEHALETEHDTSLISRYTFYLAQSYQAAGEREKSLANYLKCAEFGKGDQEVFVSLWRAAQLKEELGHEQEEVIALHLRASDAAPDRAEALHDASRLCRITGRHREGYEIAKRGLNLAAPANGLFVERWIYDYGLLDEFAVNAYWTGEYQDCLAACERLLASGELPAGLRDRVVFNASCARDRR